jgi:uncharacterized protein YciI
MPLFALACHDKPDSLDLRMATRETHLAYLNGLGATVRLAAALLDDAGAPIGSLVVVEAADRAAAQALGAADPYAAAGLFAKVEVTGMRVAIGQL